MRLASWLAVDGGADGGAACDDARVLRCPSSSASGGLSSASTVGVRRLIRSGDERALLDSVARHAHEIDRAVEQLAEAARERARTDMQARVAGALHGRKAAAALNTLPTSITAAPTQDLEAVFASLAGSLHALRSEALPGLAASVAFNRRLVGELRGADSGEEGGSGGGGGGELAPLAAAKERVAQTEHELACRVQTLLEGCVRPDRQAVRDQFHRSQERGDAGTEGGHDANAARRAIKREFQDVVVAAVPAVPASVASAVLPAAAAVPDTVVPAAAAPPPLRTPVKLSPSQPSTHTLPALHSPCVASAPPSGASSTSPSQAAFVRAMLPSDGTTSLPLPPPSLPLHPHTPSGAALQTQLGTYPAHTAMDTAEDDAEADELDHSSTSSSIPLAQPRAVSPTLSASSASSTSSPSRPLPPAAAAASMHTPMQAPRPVVEPSTPYGGGLVSLLDLQTPQMPRVLAAVTPYAAPPECACTPRIPGAHRCKYRSPPQRSPAELSVGGTGTDTGGASSSSQSALSQLYLSQSGAGGPSLPMQPFPDSQQHSLSLVLSPLQPGANPCSVEFSANSSQDLAGCDDEAEPGETEVAGDEHTPAAPVPTLSHATPLMRAPPPLSPVLDSSVEMEVDPPQLASLDSPSVISNEPHTVVVAAASTSVAVASAVAASPPFPLSAPTTAAALAAPPTASCSNLIRDHPILAQQPSRCASLPHPASPSALLSPARKATRAAAAAAANSQSQSQVDPGSGNSAAWKRKRKLEALTTSPRPASATAQQPEP